MKIYHVDAFSSERFKGNPAGVCITDEPLPVSLMQNIALEMNLSETAFLLRKNESEYTIRWFTPLREVDLCGHATLAAAHVLREKFPSGSCGELFFSSASGKLGIAFEEDSFIRLDYPALGLSPSEDIPAGIGDRSKFRNPRRHSMGLLLEMDSESELLALKPDFKQLGFYDAVCVTVTALSDKPGIDFVSRTFAPAAGVDEDPVTGAAHCALAPYWHERTGKTVFTARQLSKRGGFLRVKFDGERVMISGEAVTVFESDFRH